MPDRTPFSPFLVINILNGDIRYLRIFTHSGLREVLSLCRMRHHNRRSEVSGKRNRRHEVNAKIDWH